MAPIRGEGTPIIAVGSLSDAVGTVTAGVGKDLPAGDKLAEFVRWSQDHPANGDYIGGVSQAGLLPVLPELP